MKKQHKAQEESRRKESSMLAETNKSEKKRTRKKIKEAKVVLCAGSVTCAELPWRHTVHGRKMPGQVGSGGKSCALGDIA